MNATILINGSLFDCVPVFKTSANGVNYLLIMTKIFFLTYIKNVNYFHDILLSQILYHWKSSHM